MTGVPDVSSARRPGADLAADGDSWRQAVARTSAAPGPLAVWLGQVHVVGLLLFAFGVLFDVLPPMTALVLLVPGLGCVLLAPREVVRRMRVSVPLLALVVWMGLSWTWSVIPEQTAFRLWTSVLPLLAFMAVTAVLRLEDLAAAVRWSVRITLALVVLALLTQPAARISGSSEFVVEGWRGTVPDKNSMALYLVFALAATLALDRRVTRAITCSVIVVLLVGSQSATGSTAALLVVVLWGWLGLLRRRPVRQSAFLVLSSLGLALVVAAVVVMNLTAILEVYGKDADLTGRTDIWAAVTGAVLERPFTGYGLGALLNYTVPSEETLELWREIGFEAVHAHNGPLDLLGQLGVVGFVLYVLAVWTTARAALHKLRLLPRSSAFVLVTLNAQLLMSVSENVYLGPWLLVLVLLQAPLLRPVPAAAAAYDVSAPDR